MTAHDLLPYVPMILFVILAVGMVRVSLNGKTGQR